jgi:hypothetical protein
MASLCREALALYVERQKAELGMPPCPEVRHQAGGWAPVAVEIDPEDAWGPQWCSAPSQTRKRNRAPLGTLPTGSEVAWQDCGPLFDRALRQPDPKRYDPYLSFDTIVNPRQTFQQYPRTELDELWA